jgi:hypothetical protein
MSWRRWNWINSGITYCPPSLRSRVAALLCWCALMSQLRVTLSPPCYASDKFR